MDVFLTVPGRINALRAHHHRRAACICGGQALSLYPRCCRDGLCMRCRALAADTRERDFETGCVRGAGDYCKQKSARAHAGNRKCGAPR